MTSLFNGIILLLALSHALGAVVHTDPNSHNSTHVSYTHNHTNDSSHGNDSHKGAHGTHEFHGIHLFSLHYDYVASPLLITLFLFAAGISKLGFHHADFLSSRVPESCLLIILGIIVGAILRYTVHDKNLMPGMNSELFFLYLLPPIILEAAWSLHDRTFFDNVGTVLIYAVIGTVLNCFLIGPTLYALAQSGAMGTINVRMIECLVFSAIIVAVDPVAVLAIFQEIGVNNVLYFLVFGESLLNDAVTVVLYNMMITFSGMETIPVGQIFLGFVQFFVVSFGGITVGLVTGMLTAVITKYTEHVRVIEPLSVFVLAYMSYLIAELFHFSGIISIIACGLTQAQYAFHNISQKSHTTVKYFSKMQSSISDCIIFVFLGIALFKNGMFQTKNWHAGFIMWTLILCLFYRFFIVFLLTWFVNKSNRVRRIGKEEQFIMAYGGLRGAVAFSLVDLLEEGDLPKAMFTTTLMVLIFFTVFVQGISIKPLVKLLRVKLESTEKVTIGEEINAHITDHVMAGIEEVLGKRGEHHYREIMEHYNSKYVKNWLQKNPISTDEQIMSLYEKIALQQHFEGLAGSKMIQDKYVSDENLPLIPESVRNSIIQEETEPEESDEGSDDDTVLPPITVPMAPRMDHRPSAVIMPPPEMGTPSPPPSPTLSPSMLPLMQPDMIDDLLDRKMADRRQEERRSSKIGGRRKSLFQFKRREPSPVDNEPTAKDVRRLMAPSRRDVVHRKLDKNLKNDSSADLLKFLQEKQLRTRRMSRAVLGGGTSTPAGSQTNIYINPRRASVVNSNVAASNYRRRLSLAVPEHPRHLRERSPSDFTGMRPDSNLFRGIGDASKNPDGSPNRRRKQFKKANTLNFEPEVTPLINQKSPSKRSGGFDAIQENEEEPEDLDSSKSSASSDSPSKKRRLRFRKSKSMSGSEKSDTSSMKRSDTDPSSNTKVRFDVKSEVSPKSRKKKHMHKIKSLDHSISSGEYTDEARPSSVTDSHSSFKSDIDAGSLGNSSNQLEPETEPVTSRDQVNDGPAELEIEHEDHGGRKPSYTQAMTHMIPDDPNSVELKPLKKHDKKVTKQNSL